MEKVVYLTRLPFNMTEYNLMKSFEEYGPGTALRARVYRDEAGNSLGRAEVVCRGHADTRSIVLMITGDGNGILASHERQF